MGSITRKVTQSVTLAAFAASLLSVGCTGHVRVYDSYHHDYHAWAGETTYYTQWESDTHRDHRDFNRRSDDEKKEYWDWRHSHDRQ